MNFTKRIFTLLLGLALLLCLAACGEQEGTTSTPADASAESVEATSSQPVAESSQEESLPEAAKFSVTVVDQDGNPVSGAMVQICKESCMPAMTGEDGVANFNVEITDGYKLSVMTCPAGYTYEGEAEVYLEYGATEYTLTFTKGN